MFQYQRRITLYWILGSGFVLFIVLFSSFFGTGPFGDNTFKVLGWLCPNIIPTLSLMTTVFLSQANAQEEVNVVIGDKSSLRFVYHLVSGLIFVYFVIVAILLKAAQKEENCMEWLGSSSAIVGPVQGVITGLLGAFFVRPKKQ